MFWYYVCMFVCACVCVCVCYFLVYVCCISVERDTSSQRSGFILHDELVMWRKATNLDWFPWHTIQMMLSLLLMCCNSLFLSSAHSLSLSLALSHTHTHTHTNTHNHIFTWQTLRTVFKAWGRHFKIWACCCCTWTTGRSMWWLAWHQDSFSSIHTLSRCCLTPS